MFLGLRRSQTTRGRQTLWQGVSMKHNSITVLTGAFLLAAATQAENAHFTEGKQAFTSVKNILVQMAEVMPEENYGFKPTPEIRSFGEMVAHVANAQAGICS